MNKYCFVLRSVLALVPFKKIFSKEKREKKKAANSAEGGNGERISPAGWPRGSADIMRSECLPRTKFAALFLPFF